MQTGAAAAGIFRQKIGERGKLIFSNSDRF
jgi:hypothetical protein